MVQFMPAGMQAVELLQMILFDVTKHTIEDLSIPGSINEKRFSIH